MTVIERKVMGSMQRRIGPNVVFSYALLQPFADALKLVIQEQILPSQATKSLCFLAPMVTLISSLTMLITLFVLQPSILLNSCHLLAL